MSRHRVVVSLRHMLDHSRETVAMVRGKTRRDLDADRKLNLALVRLLEIVGEAANRIPKQEQTLQPGIPWAELVGLRNRLIHGYDVVDFDILWQADRHPRPAAPGQRAGGDPQPECVGLTHFSQQLVFLPPQPRFPKVGVGTGKISSVS